MSSAPSSTMTRWMICWRWASRPNVAQPTGATRRANHGPQSAGVLLTLKLTNNPLSHLLRLRRCDSMPKGDYDGYSWTIAAGSFVVVSGSRIAGAGELWQRD